jgi:hypothetical protein
MADTQRPDFDPDRVWGEGNWVAHEECPAAVAITGESQTVIHSKGFHRRPLLAKREVDAQT